MTTLAQSALALCVKGYSVIPIVPKGKVPAVSWKSYQTKPASAEQVIRWWQMRPDYNVAICTGLVSGLSVLDHDPRNDPTGTTLARLQALLPEPNVRTGGGGSHWYVKAARASAPNLLPGLDFKSNGGYVICPPSVHPSGDLYRPVRLDVLTLPAELKEMIKRAGARMAAAACRQTRDKTPTTSEDGLTLDDVLGVLQGAKQTSKGWLARCPAHDDHAPSLSVGEGRDGRLLVRCWVGCTFSEIMVALRNRRTRQLVQFAQSLGLSQ